MLRPKGCRAIRMTDEDILRLIHSPLSREKGFKELVNQYQQRLYAVIRRRLEHHEDADDILQNTFLKVFKGIHGFESKSSIFTWMYRIAMNEITDFQRAARKNRTEEMKISDEGIAHLSPDMNQLHTDLEILVSSLPERQQAVFRMRYYDELPYAEIAELLKVSEGSLKASFHHAVKKIEEQIQAKQIF